jgi:polyribonucleotide nucleotidyltransferase
MRIKDITKRYHLALRKIEEALYQYKIGNIEAVNEELLFALDETIKAKQNLDNYIKELQRYRKNLEAIEESIMEAIEARYVNEEMLKEIKKKYKKLLNKLIEKSLMIVETPNNGYKYN